MTTRAYSGPKPKRCSKRWLDADCPNEVLAIIDNGGRTFDRFTVFYTDATEWDGDLWVHYRGMSSDPTAPNGFGISDEMKSHDVAAYRYRNKHHYMPWSNLPDAVKATVRRDCEAIRATDSEV